MVARRWRLAAGVLSGALAIVLCAVLVDRFVLNAEWWQVRHTVTTRPVAPQGEIGPPPGPLTVSWERTARIHHGPVAAYDSVAYEVADGQVVTASGRGLEVRDARTGDDRWSYRRAGWTLLGWASTGARLVAYFERDGDRGDRQMVGLDALSGGLLWRRGDAEHPAAAGRATLRWPAAEDVVLTTDERRRELYGRSAATGSRVWRMRLPARCALFDGRARPAAGGEDLAVVALDCPARSRLIALDPRNGRVRWNHPLGSRGAPEVAMVEGVTLAADGSALRAYDRDGKQFAEWPGDAVCGDGTLCPGALLNGRLVVSYHPRGEPEGASRLEAVEVASGRRAWSREAPEYAAFAQAGDRIYGLRARLAEGLLPAGVDIIEPTYGGARTAPAPFAVDPEIDGVRPWLAAAGGLLYVAVPEAAPRPDGAARLVALRGGPAGTGPAELGGVPESDWPDACGLLKRPDLAAVRMDDYETRPGRAGVGTVKLPRPVTCAYEAKEPKKRAKARQDDRPRDERTLAGEPGADRPNGDLAPGSSRPDHPKPGPSGTKGSPDPKGSKTAGKPDDSGLGEAESSDRTLRISVRWVAPTGSAASGLLDALQSTQSKARRRTDLGGDEVYELGPTAGTIAMRVDRYIIVIDANRTSGTAVSLAKSVATRLHRPPP